MFGQTQTSYEFGPFRIDSRERQLLKDGEVVPLRPKVFDLLLVLLINSGHTLSKDEMMKLVWPNTIVEEGNIARSISTLRNALGEGPREHQYIETVPWRGYRFVANVKQVRAEVAQPPIDSIAVLPFVNVNAEPKSEFLSDGITESLIASLAQLTNLRVTSRNSAFRYKGRPIDAQKVGRELRVQTVLMGRIAEFNDSLSISVELIDVSNDRHLWGAQYVRKSTDVLRVQEIIAREIGEKLRLQLTSDTKQLLERRSTYSNEAYLLYLKGRYYFNKLTPDGAQRGIEYLQKAIEQDPDYALAYAALGDCHNYLAQRDDAKRAVMKALELDGELGEAHASLGFFHFLYDWDFAGAEREFRKAIALNPNYAEAHHWYSIYLANLGRHDEADQQAKNAVELDPLSLLMNMTPALNFYLARQYDQAIEQLQKVIEMEPNFPAARSVLGTVYVHKEMYEEAFNEYEKVIALSKGLTVIETAIKVIMGHAYARWGKRSEASRLLEEVTMVGSVSEYAVAGIYAALGEPDLAFEWLNKACDNHDVQLVSAKIDPMLEGLWSDARFNQLLRRVGLPQ